MKHIKLFEAKKVKTSISALLGRFNLMPDSWKKIDNDKLIQRFQEDIADLDQNIKDVEKKLELLKERRKKMSDQFIEYRKEYRKK